MRRAPGLLKLIIWMVLAHLAGAALAWWVLRRTEFAHPEVLSSLALIPLVSIWIIIRWRRRQTGVTKSYRPPDIIKPKTFFVLVVSSVLLSAICLLNRALLLDIIQEPIPTTDTTLRHTYQAWVDTLLTIIFIILLIIGVFLLTRGKSKRKVPAWWLYIIFLIIATIIFCLVNLTGGVVHSPFTPLYGALITVTILIYERFIGLFYSCTVVAFGMFLSLHLQNRDLCNPIDIEISKARSLHVSVTLVLFTILALVDFISKRYKSIPPLKQFYDSFPEEPIEDTTSE
mgnify:CR=1 FL=1